MTPSVRRVALLLPFVAPAACAPLIDFDALGSGNGADASRDATADAHAEASADDAPAGDADGGPQVDATDGAIVGDSASDVPDAAPFDAGDPCAKVPTVDNGYYCGASLMNGFSGGVPNDLYLCVDGSAASTTPCPVDCVTAPLDFPDTCDQCATKPDGTWCGSEFPGYLPELANVKFTCTAGKNNGTPIACVNATPKCHPADGGATCGT